MECDPTENEATVSTAWPTGPELLRVATSGAVPRVVPPSLKVMVPVAAKRLQLDEPTSAVMVTGCPYTGAGTESVRATVGVSPFTVWVSADETLLL